MRRVLITGVCFSALACAHVVTNEERVELALAPQAESADADSLRCRDTSPEIQLARDVKTAKAERLSRYESAVAQMKATEGRFDEEFRRDPDLVYGPKADEWKHRQQVCVELLTVLQHEREQLSSAVDAAAPSPAAVEATPVAAQAPATVEAPSDDARPKKSGKQSKAQKARLAKAKKHGRNAQLARADE